MSQSESSNNSTSTHQLLFRQACAGLDLQQDDGSFPPGRNYTYDEPETPVRTTSQWLETLTKAYEITGEAKFSTAAERAIEYLLSEETRPHGYTYYCRETPSKDQCNGLVGQAAPIRALAKASEVFDRQDARETAEDVFELHPFSEKLGLWERVEVNGELLSFDRTLNHQIIFAAASVQLAQKNELVDQRLRHFLDRLQENVRTHGNGLIKHYVRPPMLRVFQSVANAPHRYDMLINEVMFYYYSLSEERKKKERGYQTVNLEALSVLREEYPEHAYWESDNSVDSLEFIRENERELLDGVRTKHGNPLQGIAIAKIYHRFFEEPMDELQYLINEDLNDKTGDKRTVFDIDGVDENTRAALVSVLTDLPNVDLSEHND